MKKTENELVHKITPFDQNSETCSFLRSRHEENELIRAERLLRLHTFGQKYTFNLFILFSEYNYENIKRNKK